MKTGKQGMRKYYKNNSYPIVIILFLFFCYNK
jgi:hypothetical protein